MKDLHEIFAVFKKEFPKVWAHHDALGKEIHENGGAPSREGEVAHQGGGISGQPAQAILGDTCGQSERSRSNRCRN